MNILFVCENYLPHYGGAEVVFKNLAEKMAKQGHDVNLVTHQLKGTKRYEEINGVKVHRIPCFHSRYLFTFFSIPKVIQLAKKADIIQTTTFNGAPPSWVASKFTKTPVVLTVHEVWINKWKELTEFGAVSCAIHNLLEKMIYLLRYSHYITVSNSTKKDLLTRKIPEKKVSTVHNGFNYELWQKDFDSNIFKDNFNLKNKFVYFSWGRPGVSKGHEYIIQAARKIKQTIPNSMFVLMLSNRQTYSKRYSHLKSLIHQYKLQDHILLVNSVPYDELGDYIKSSDCVVLPSLSEGFGYCVLEANEVGTPVVATDNASIPEVIWGKHILIPPKDSNAISSAVIDVSKGNYTTSKKKIFDWKTSVESYLQIYRQLIQKV